MTNKILMVGVLDVPSSTNVFMAKGFEQLGYEVEAYNYRTVEKELGNPFDMWSHFRDYTYKSGQKYKLIVFCKTNSMHPELLAYAKQSGPTWYWFMDPIGTAKACMASEYAKHATYASATSSEVISTFKEVNDNSFHIIEGYDPDIYFYEDLEKIYDITFIGNVTDKRIRDIGSLRESGVKICIFGGGWPWGYDALPPVYNEEERRVINQSKIVLNLCQDDTIFSDRVVKSLGCGAIVVSQYCKDLYNMFGTALSFYKNPDQAATIVKCCLHPSLSNDVDRKYIKDKVETYSWKAVCKQIMEQVNGK